MAEFVIDHCRIHRPIHSGNRPCRQLVVKSSSFADERKAVAFLDQRLHLVRMRSVRILRDPAARIGKQLKKPLMRIWMRLRVYSTAKSSCRSVVCNTFGRYAGRCRRGLSRQQSLRVGRGAVVARMAIRMLRPGLFVQI